MPVDTIKLKRSVRKHFLVRVKTVSYVIIKHVFSGLTPDFLPPVLPVLLHSKLGLLNEGISLGQRHVDHYENWQEDVG